MDRPFTYLCSLSTAILSFQKSVKIHWQRISTNNLDNISHIYCQTVTKKVNFLMYYPVFVETALFYPFCTFNVLQAFGLYKMVSS